MTILAVSYLVLSYNCLFCTPRLWTLYDSNCASFPWHSLWLDKGLAHSSCSLNACWIMVTYPIYLPQHYWTHLLATIVSLLWALKTEYFLNISNGIISGKGSLPRKPQLSIPVKQAERCLLDLWIKTRKILASLWGWIF